MRKVIAAFIAGMLIMLTVSVLAESIQTIEVIFGRVKLFVNGEPIAQETLLYQGVTYVPLRAVSEALDVDVEWDGETNTARLTKKETEQQVMSEPVLIPKPTPVPTPKATPAPTSLPSPTPKPASSSGQFVLTEGEWIVGKDIPAGRYSFPPGSILTITNNDEKLYVYDEPDGGTGRGTIGRMNVDLTNGKIIEIKGIPSMTFSLLD